MDYETGVRLDQIIANQTVIDKKLSDLIKVLSEPTKKKTKTTTTEED